MAISASVQTRVTIQNTQFDGVKSYSDESATLTPSLSIASDAVDAEFAVTIPDSDLVLLGLFATVDMTVKTNSSGDPDDTFTLKAGVPYVWTADAPFANPISEPVASIFVTNTSSPAEAGSLGIVVLQNAVT